MGFGLSAGAAGAAEPAHPALSGFAQGSLGVRRGRAVVESLD